MTSGSLSVFSSSFQETPSKLFPSSPLHPQKQLQHIMDMCLVSVLVKTFTSSLVPSTDSQTHDKEEQPRCYCDISSNSLIVITAAEAATKVIFCQTTILSPLLQYFLDSNFDIPCSQSACENQFNDMRSSYN